MPDPCMKCKLTSESSSNRLRFAAGPPLKDISYMPLL